MDIVRSLQLESFILTKLTKPLVRINLVGPQVSFRNGAPQMSGGGIIFWAGEARISEKKKQSIRWMDIQRPLLLEPCVDYKLTKPCIRVNSLFFEGTRQLSKATSVWQRTYSPFEICKNVQPIFEF